MESAVPAAARFGEGYDPLGEHLVDPYPVYAQAQAQAPVFYSPVGRAWVVTRYADVRTVLRQPHLYSAAAAIPRPFPVCPAALAVLQQGYPPTPTLTESDDPLHRRLRVPFERLLSLERVQTLEPFVTAEAERLVDGFAADGRVELMSRYANVLPVRTVAHLCALDEPDATRLRELCQATIEMSGADLDEAAQVAAANRFLELQRMTARLVRERHRGNGTDAITEIVRGTVGEDELDFPGEALAVNTLL